MGKMICVRIHQQGKVIEQRLEISDGQVFMLGRGDDVQLRFSTATGKVSRHHCSFQIENGNLTVMDNRSTNGTFVNGKQIDSCKLKVDDKISLGNEVTIEILDCADTEITAVDIKAPTPNALPQIPVTLPPISMQESQPQRVPNTLRETMQKDKNKTQMPNAKDSLPSPEYFSHSSENGQFDGPDTIELTVDFCKGFYQNAFKNYQTFFQTLNVSGDVSTSLILIAISGCIAGFLQFLSFRTSPYFSFMGGSIIKSIVQGAIFTPVFGIVAAGICQLLRGFLGVRGEFSNFLRYFTYSMLLLLPVTLLGIVSFGITGILSLGICVWLIYGFFVIFKPKPVPYFCLLLTPFILSSLMTSLFTFGGRTIATFALNQASKEMEKGPSERTDHRENVAARKELTQEMIKIISDPQLSQADRKQKLKSYWTDLIVAEKTARGEAISREDAERFVETYMKLYFPAGRETANE